MIWICIGVLAFVSSIFLLFFPKPFVSINDFFNRVFVTDAKALKYKLGIGISLILVSFLLFFTAYYIARI